MVSLLLPFTLVLLSILNYTYNPVWRSVVVIWLSCIVVVLYSIHKDNET